MALVENANCFGTKEFRERFHGKFGHAIHRVNDRAARSRQALKASQSRKAITQQDEARNEALRLEAEAELAAFEAQLHAVAAPELHPAATEAQRDALVRAQSGQSMANWPAIIEGFTAKGIPASEIDPRVNVLTFAAWKALGRSVKKGEHGVKVCTFITTTQKDKVTGEVVKTGRMPRNTTVFHISQTKEV